MLVRADVSRPMVHLSPSEPPSSEAGLLIKTLYSDCTMCATPAPSIRGAGRAQRQAGVDAQALPGQRCDKSRRGTSTSPRGGARTRRRGRGPAVPLLMPKTTFAARANRISDEFAEYSFNYGSPH